MAHFSLEKYRQVQVELDNICHAYSIESIESEDKTIKSVTIYLRVRFEVFARKESTTI